MTCSVFLMLEGLSWRICCRTQEGSSFPAVCFLMESWAATNEGSQWMFHGNRHQYRLDLYFSLESCWYLGMSFLVAVCLCLWPCPSPHRRRSSWARSCLSHSYCSQRQKLPSMLPKRYSDPPQCSPVSSPFLSKTCTPQYWRNPWNDRLFSAAARIAK